MTKDKSALFIYDISDEKKYGMYSGFLHLSAYKSVAELRLAEKTMRFAI